MAGFEVSPEGWSGKELGTWANEYIMIFTHVRTVFPRGTDAQPKSQARQARHPAAAGNPQSPSRGGHRPTVSGKRVLRRPGSDPSQVRDAASCRSGKRFGEPKRGRVWSFPSVLLSGAVRLRASRPGRPDPAEARAATGAQAVCRGHGLYSAISNSPAVTADSGTGATGPGTLRRADPSSEHRAETFPPAKKRR